MFHQQHTTPDARGHVTPPPLEIPHPSRGPVTIAANAARGALVGLAELVPGVSGGTVALVTGVYARLLASASHGVDAMRALATGPDRWTRARSELRRIDWWLIVPFVVGMATVVATMAGVMKAFVTDQPVTSRALFFGMVAASVAVPVLMVRRLPGNTTWRSLAFVAVGFAAAFSLAGAGAEIANPPLLMVFGAAALAVCALVLPGVSGSYLLLVLGLYAATTGAVADRDLTYLAVFAAGAAFGLALFAKALNLLLTRQPRGTLLVMTGLMLGSLRALWPWQSDAGLVAPEAGWPLMAAVALVGAAAVLALLVIERRFGAAHR